MKQVPPNSHFKASPIVFESLNASNQNAAKILQVFKQVYKNPIIILMLLSFAYVLFALYGWHGAHTIKEKNPRA
jgi:hypothetical protein